MSERHLEVDFNSSKLTFSIKKLSQYNFDTIYANIDAFKKFMFDSVISDAFDKVFETQMFQLMLLDDSTNYSENLTAVYNAIAEGDLLDGEVLPQISQNELIRQLQVRGYTVTHTTIRSSGTKGKHVRRIEKEDRPIWN